jgi:nucleoside-triphosphatase
MGYCYDRDTDMMNSFTRHVLLLTGRPGVGKTTGIRRIAASLAGWRLAGFYTDEIRESGQRQGFRAVTFDGSEKVMAHANIHSSHRVGRYGVDLSVIDQLADLSLGLMPEVDCYLVDEIGKMECCSQRFITAMRRLLTSHCLVVATIALRGGGFIAEVKQRAGVEQWEVTLKNREELPERALAWLRAAHGPAPLDSRHEPGMSPDRLQP